MAKDIKVKGKPLRARNKFLREDRERKRVEAATRQESRNARTVEQQIAKLDAGGYVAAKERLRLLSRATQDAQVVVDAIVEKTMPEPPKEKKGQKARRQNRKDKNAK